MYQALGDISGIVARPDGAGRTGVAHLYILNFNQQLKNEKIISKNVIRVN